MKKKGVLTIMDFIAIIKKCKGITVNDASRKVNFITKSKGTIHINHTDIEIWGYKETLERLKFLCPNECELQQIDGKNYLLTVFNTAKQA